MKKLILSLLFLCVGISGYAQTATSKNQLRELDSLKQTNIRLNRILDTLRIEQRAMNVKLGQIKLNTDTIVKRAIVRSFTLTAASQATIAYASGQTVTEAGKSTSYSLSIPTDGSYAIEYVLMYNNNATGAFKMMFSYGSVTTGTNYVTFSPTTNAETIFNVTGTFAALQGSGTYLSAATGNNSSPSIYYPIPIPPLTNGILYCNVIASGAVTPLTNQVFIFRVVLRKL